MDYVYRVRAHLPITAATRSKTAQTPGSWVRITLEARVPVCDLPGYELSCVDSAPATK
jgi:hypothetical protein